MHPQRGVSLFTKMSAVTSAVNSSAKMSARLLKTAEKQTMHDFPLVGTGRGPTQPTLIAMSGPEGKGSDRTGQRNLCLDVGVMALKEVSKPPPWDLVHAPPILTALGHGKRASDPKVSGSVGVTAAHDPTPPLVWQPLMIQRRMESGT